MIALVACSHTPPASTPTGATPVPSAAPAISPIPPGAAVAKEWDPALAALVGRATTMRVSRVAMNPSTDAVTFGPDVEANALARRAASAILTKTTDKRKRCGFTPGVAVRLCDEKNDCATILVCFQCDDIAVMRPTGGTFTGILDFHDARAEFVAIAKEALPNDAEIQKL